MTDVPTAPLSAAPIRRERSVWLSLQGIAVVVCAVVLLAAVYGRLMHFGLRRDEMLFVPPVVLMDEFKLYTDFFYNHVPYSAWYLRAMETLFGWGGLLFSARLGVFLAWTVLVGAMGWICARLSGSFAVGVFGAASLICSQTLLGTPGMAATNNLLQLPFALLGLGIFLIEIREWDPRSLRLILSGIFLSIAAGMKASAIAFIPPVALAAFLLPTHMSFGHRLSGVVFPVFIGGMIGAIPLFWYLLSDPELFLAHVLEFHLGPHIAYWEANAASEPGLALGLTGKMQLAYGIWLGGTALICALVALSAAFAARQNEVRRNELSSGPVFVVLLTLALTVAMSVLPTPGFPQYYVAPLICLPLLVALLFGHINSERQERFKPVVTASVIVMLILSVPLLGPALPKLRALDDSTVARSLKGGKALREALPIAETPDQKIATFMPIYPLEAGLAVYPELATGQFAYRIAPFTEPSLAAKYKMAGETDLLAMFDRDPPAAFLLGYEPDLEAPMLQYANAHGYAQVQVSDLDNRYGDGVVYVRPAAGN